jgi:hypothetical protein
MSEPEINQESSTPPSFEAQVNEVVSSATVDGNGNLTLPEGVSADESVMFAATLTKRQRDTQSAYTKSQQALTKLTEQNAQLTSLWEKDAVKAYTPAEQTALDELKTQDPDAWHAKLTEMEVAKRDAFKATLTTIDTAAEKAAAIASRTEMLKAYNTLNPATPLTDDVIANDVPPRLTKQLEEGKIDFATFLASAGKYLGTPKAIAGSEQAESSPSLSGARGGSKPTKSAVDAQNASDYTKEIF